VKPIHITTLQQQNTYIIKGSGCQSCALAGFSLRIEVAGGYYKITGESGHSEKNLTSSFYRPMKFSRKIPCSSRRILRSPMLNEHPVAPLKVFLCNVSVLDWNMLTD